MNSKKLNFEIIIFKTFKLNLKIQLWKIEFDEIIAFQKIEFWKIEIERILNDWESWKYNFKKPNLQKNEFHKTSFS